MLRIYAAELSCVGGVYASVGCCDPVYNSAANGTEVGQHVTHDAAHYVIMASLVTSLNSLTVTG